MAWTSADLDKVKAAIASGQLRVKYGDREIVYHTVEGMIRAKAEIERELAKLAGSNATYRTDRRYADFHPGFEADT